MENAIWKGKLVKASDLSKEYYENEKQVRIASRNKEFSCPDPDCSHPILKYCNGEIKNPFFAHLHNAQCDYYSYDKETSNAHKNIKQLLYNHFLSIGYKVETEAKIIKHHYTHLLIYMPDGKRIAIEFGTNKMTVHQVEKMVNDYAENGIEVKWIFIYKGFPRAEDSGTFIKRFCFHETKNKDLIVIDEVSLRVAQYRFDAIVYEHKNKIYQSKNYPQVYDAFRHLDINSLILDNGELTLKGFDSDYNIWLIRKKKAFERMIEDIEQQAIKDAQLEKAKKDNESLWKGNSFKKTSTSNIPFKLKTRTVKCYTCGKVANDDEFVRIFTERNVGLCRECYIKSEKERKELLDD